MMRFWEKKGGREKGGKECLHCTALLRAVLKFVIICMGNLTIKKEQV